MKNFSFIVFLLCGCVNVEGIFMNEAELASHLMSTYVDYAMPMLEYGTSLKLYLQADIRRLDGLDERSQTVTTTFDILFVWKDEFLTWNVSEANNIMMLPLPATKIWTPTVILPNSVGDTSLDFSAVEVLVTSEGYVIAPTVQRLVSHCPVHLQKFPMDKQECRIELALSLPEGCIQIQEEMLPMFADAEADPNAASKEEGEWAMTLDYNVSSYTNQATTGDLKMSMATITMQLTRNPVFYQVYLVLPSLLMGCCSVLVFLLPPESGERVGLSITILLSYTVLLLMASEVTPQGGVNIPYIMIYITIVEFLGTMNLVATVVLLRMFYTPRDKPCPAWAERMLGRKTRVSDKLVKLDDTGNKQRIAEENTTGSDEKNPWVEMQELVDKILFYFSLVVVGGATLMQIIVMYT